MFNGKVVAQGVDHLTELERNLSEVEGLNLVEIGDMGGDTLFNGRWLDVDTRARGGGWVKVEEENWGERSVEGGKTSKSGCDSLLSQSAVDQVVLGEHARDVTSAANQLRTIGKLKTNRSVRIVGILSATEDLVNGSLNGSTIDKLLSCEDSRDSRRWRRSSAYNLCLARRSTSDASRDRTKTTEWRCEWSIDDGRHCERLCL